MTKKQIAEELLYHKKLLEQEKQKTADLQKTVESAHAAWQDQTRECIKLSNEIKYFKEILRAVGELACSVQTLARATCSSPPIKPEWNPLREDAFKL